MARTRNAIIRYLAAGALIFGLSAPTNAHAWRNVPLKERHIEKIPYHPEWVTALKKGGLFKYKRKEYSSPRILGDSAFVGTDSGFFYAMKTKNGRKIWRFKATGPINSAPSFWNDRVIFGDDDGHLYALKTSNGDQVWRADLGAEILSAPAVGGNRIYVETSEGTVAAVNAEDGKVLWTTEHKKEFTGSLELSIRGGASPALDPSGERLYVGYSDGSIGCLASSTGKVLWDKSLVQDKAKGFTDVDGTPLIDGDRLYTATFDGGVYALSLKKGSVLWSAPEGSGVRMLLYGDLLIVASSNGHLYAFDAKDGTRHWDSPIGHGALTAPVAYKDLIAVGLSGSTMNFIDANDGHIIARRFARKGIFSDPVVDGNRIYYLSNGGRLYSLKLIR